MLGHGAIILHEEKLFKPAPTTEADFYDNIEERLPAILPFIPKYFGRRAPPGAGPIPASQNIRCTAYRILIVSLSLNWLPYIALEDLTRGMQAACILDLKMGTVLTADWAPAKKVQQREEVARSTTIGSLGICISGMRVWKEHVTEYL